MGCRAWLKTQISGLAFSVKTPRATPSVFWLPKPVPRAGFSSKPSTPWLKPIAVHYKQRVFLQYIIMWPGMCSQSRLLHSSSSFFWPLISEQCLMFFFQVTFMDISVWINRDICHTKLLNRTSSCFSVCTPNPKSGSTNPYVIPNFNP